MLRRVSQTSKAKARVHCWGCWDSCAGLCLKPIIKSRASSVGCTAALHAMLYKARTIGRCLPVVRRWKIIYRIYRILANGKQRSRCGSRGQCGDLRKVVGEREGASPTPRLSIAYRRIRVRKVRYVYLTPYSGLHPALLTTNLPSY